MLRSVEIRAEVVIDGYALPKPKRELQASYIGMDPEGTRGVENSVTMPSIRTEHRNRKNTSSFVVA